MSTLTPAGSRLSQALLGQALAGEKGDWLIERGRLQAVVGATEVAARQHLRGVLLDVALGSWGGDELRALRTVLFEGKHELPLTTVSVEAIEHGVRVQQQVRGRGLLVTTAITASGDDELVLETVVTASEPATNLRLGDRLEWHGPTPFVPEHGFIEEPGARSARWVGQQGRTLSYALAFGAATQVDFVFDRGAAVEQLALGPVLAPGHPQRWQRRLVVAEGGLERVAARAWRASGVLVSAFENRVKGGDARSRVHIHADTGELVLAANVLADGSWTAPLPHGTYRAVLMSPGGKDSADLTVTAAGGVLSNELVSPAPGQIGVSVRDEAGGLLAARVRVIGISPTTDPDFGSEQLARGTGNVAYTATGEIELLVPPGTYEVIVTNGPERELSRASVEVDAERGAQVRARLTRVVDATGWVACDMHVHAAPSHDSRVPLPDRVTTLLAEGIGFVAATDHNHVTDYAPTVAELGVSNLIATVAGVEITTQKWGHFNAFPYPPGAAAPPVVDVSPTDIFAHVRSAAPGALLQVNHPRMGSMGYFNAGELDASQAQAKQADMSFDFDTIELFNGLELGDRAVTDGLLTEWFQLLSQGRRYIGVGNSDSHKVVSQWVGYPRTYVFVGALTPNQKRDEEVVAALRAGRAVVSNGPLLRVWVAGQLPGSQVTPTNGMVTLKVDVQAPAWIDVTQLELIHDGTVVPLVATPGEGAVKLKVDTRIAVARDGWMVVRARGERVLEELLPGSGATSYAFSNPVWIDADGDGTVAPTVPAPPSVPAVGHAHAH